MTMHRLSGQDASFLYAETKTVHMHTLKIQIFDSPFADSDYELLHGWLESALHEVPMLRQRVMFVPGKIHHPVMVDDPDFDLESHIFRAALPAPGGKAEFDQMISQILCHRLDRQRPLWELWALSGLAGGKIAIVHKVHHCLADGAATVRYLAKVFERHAHTSHDAGERIAPPWNPPPLPSGRRLFWQALVDHVRYDIRRLPGFISSLAKATRNMIRFNREVGSPTVDHFTAHPAPRTRFNHSLSARRNFTTRQLPLAEVKALGKQLGGTVNDVVLALSAGAARDYLLFHGDLPDEPLQISVPVSADEANTTRDFGNRTSYFPTSLWVNIADPVERFTATRNSSEIGKRELEAIGKSTVVELMHFLPPAMYIWRAERGQRLHIADREDYKPAMNMLVSNVPGPRNRQTGNYGTLEDIYSIGPLMEGCGLNITAWSYAGNINFSIMGCKKAIPDLDRLADGLPEAMRELQRAAGIEESGSAGTTAMEGSNS